MVKYKVIGRPQVQQDFKLKKKCLLLVGDFWSNPSPTQFQRTYDIFSHLFNIWIVLACAMWMVKNSNNFICCMRGCRQQQPKSLCSRNLRCYIRLGHCASTKCLCSRIFYIFFELLSFF